MIGVTWIHVAGGMVALLSGAVAVSVRKGGSRHIAAGTWFCVSMLVLGVTASILSPFKSPPESPLGGVMVCYFIATAWITARRRSGTPGRFEIALCALVLLIAVAIIGHGFEVAYAEPGKFRGPPGPAVLFALGGVCLLAGLGDLRFILRGKLGAVQRITRHLWRMCFAFFIATGSFFFGQQKVLPQSLRGSLILVVLALAPIVLMAFWLVRVRYSRAIRALNPPDAAVGSRADSR